MPDPKEISLAIKQICEEKGIPFESVIESIEAALAVAYRKEVSKKGKDIRVEFNPNEGSMRIFEVYTVVPDDLYAEYLKDKEAQEAKGETVSQAEPVESKTEDGEEEKQYFNPKTKAHTTVSFHSKAIPVGTLRSIIRQSQLNSDLFRR